MERIPFRPVDDETMPSKADGEGESSVAIVDLPPELTDAAVALWHESGLTRPWNDPHSDLDRAVASDSSTILAAVADGVLQGTIMVGHDGHRGWSYYLAVASGNRAKGLGTRLLAAAEEWLREREVPKAMLMVRESNDAVLDFYRKRGYEEQNVRVLGKFFDSALTTMRRNSAS